MMKNFYSSGNLLLVIILYNPSLCVTTEVQSDNLDNGDIEITQDASLVESGSMESLKICEFVGTNLFGADGCRQKCFSAEDIALLAARRDFEAIIPKNLPKCLLDDKMIMTLMQYFYGANQVIQRMASGGSKRIAEKAFYDALGGYLKHYIIPVSKYSFYAGMVCLKTVENVFRLYRQCKSFLNTNGNGWLYPIHNIQSEFNFRVRPVKIFVSQEESDEAPACINLEMNAGDIDDDHMIVSLPKLEPEESDGYLSNIWLPFKRKRTFNLRSEQSAFIVLKYFETVSRCYNFQSICQDTFNKKLREWILENIEVHLADDVLYPGLGAILRVYETVRQTRSPVVNEEDLRSLKPTPLEVEKRHKSHEYRLLEHKAKEFDASNWFSKMFTGIKTNIADDHGDVDNFENSLKTSDRSADDYGDPERRLKYIYITIGISAFLLLIVLIAAVITEKRARQKEDFLSKPPPPRRLRICQICKNTSCRCEDQRKVKTKRKSSSPKRESFLISSTASSSSSKCIPTCLKKSKDDEKKKSAPIIETTSMDSSSTDHRKKTKNKRKESPTKRKSVTINEKSNKGKRRMSGGSESFDPDMDRLPVRSALKSTGRGDDTSDQKTKSSSWETVYEP